LVSKTKKAENFNYWQLLSIKKLK